MPVIASAIIPINIKEDHTIEVLFLNEVKRCGCANVKTISSQLNVSLEYVREMARKLAGDGVIECEKDTCCVDSEQLDLFVGKIKALSDQESQT